MAVRRWPASVGTMDHVSQVEYRDVLDHDGVSTGHVFRRGDVG